MFRFQLPLFLGFEAHEDRQPLKVGVHVFAGCGWNASVVVKKDLVAVALSTVVKLCNFIGSQVYEFDRNGVFVIPNPAADRPAKRFIASVENYIGSAVLLFQAIREVGRSEFVV